MATRAQNLDTALDNAAANLAAITASPKPTYTIDGETYQWGELYELYTSQLEALEKARQRADGPWLVDSQGI